MRINFSKQFLDHIIKDSEDNIRQYLERYPNSKYDMEESTQTNLLMGMFAKEILSLRKFIDTFQIEDKYINEAVEKIIKEMEI